MRKNCMNCKKSINREFGCAENYFQNLFDCDCELLTEEELDMVENKGDISAEECSYYECDETIEELV